MEDKKYDVEKKEKLSFRYSTRGIWIFITIITIISLIGTVFLNSFGTDFFGRVSKEDFYDMEFRNEIYSILNENDYYNYDYNPYGNNKISFFTRSYGISNYEFTKEYKEKNPTNVAVRNDNTGEIIDLYNINDLPLKESRQRSDIDTGEYLSYSDEITEEPIYTTKVKTNLDFDNSTNPQEIPLKSNEIGVKGYVENGNVIITNSSDTDSNEKDKNGILKKTFNGSVKNVLWNSMNHEYKNGKDKLNFCFILDTNSSFVKNLEDKYILKVLLAPSMLISSFIALFVVAVFTTISNYKKSKEVSFYKGISRFPVEVVILLEGFLFSGIALFSDGFIAMDDRIGKPLLYVIQLLFVFFSSITTFYTIHLIKSMYNEGTSSFVFQNSITIKICKWCINLCKKIFKKIRNIISKFLSEFEVFNKRQVMLLYFGLIIVGWFVISAMANEGAFPLIVLWILFISAVFKYLKKYYIDLLNVSEKSKQIADGNYDVKINEGETIFKDIAHSFNTIGDNLNEAVDKAIKSERLKTELITNVSHDLKTPLTSIINYSELIVDEKNNFDKQKEYAKVINEKSLKLKKLIEDLFEVTKVTSNNIELHIEDIDFKQLLNQIIGEWSDKFEEKHLNINLNIPEEEVVLKLDGNKTSRILDNLFSNLYKYSLEGTRVYIDLEKGNKVSLTIKNISKYSLNISTDELMERFARGDSSRNTEGSGLGLSISSSLVDAQGGSFEIEIDGDLFKTIIEF